MQPLDYVWSSRLTMMMIMMIMMMIIIIIIIIIIHARQKEITEKSPYTHEDKEKKHSCRGIRRENNSCARDGQKKKPVSGPSAERFTRSGDEMRPQT